MGPSSSCVDWCESLLWLANGSASSFSSSDSIAPELTTIDVPWLRLSPSGATSSRGDDSEGLFRCSVLSLSSDCVLSESPRVAVICSTASPAGVSPGVGESSWLADTVASASSVSLESALLLCSASLLSSVSVARSLCAMVPEELPWTAAGIESSSSSTDMSGSSLLTWSSAVTACDPTISAAPESSLLVELPSRPSSSVRNWLREESDESDESPWLSPDTSGSCRRNVFPLSDVEDTNTTKDAIVAITFDMSILPSS
mmetsp:Transcript_8622/g.16324  ORF Transcript_8622/g.16324 Transcript_8622/m.16324 type:complete len:258 (-) Transcript_8622:58-831(-)